MEMVEEVLTGIKKKGELDMERTEGWTQKGSEVSLDPRLLRKGKREYREAREIFPRAEGLTRGGAMLYPIMLSRSWK